MRNELSALLWALSLVACGGGLADSESAEVVGVREASTPTKLSVGKRIFFDTALSEPAGQSCASCHDPNHGFADPRPGPTSAGAVSGRFGSRNAPTIAYASFIPKLTAAGDESGYAGGLFWDGRSPDLTAQAEGPMLNPLEMNNADRAAVVRKLKAAPYAAQFKKVFGSKIFDDVDTAFDAMTAAIAEYETSGIPNRFTSKYDAYLAGWVTLSRSEQRGLALFEDTTKGACSSCHLDKLAASGASPLFTDHGYDNLGIPKNPANPFYKLPAELNPAGEAYLDRGLAASIINPRQVGRFKAPTLRNIALTAPYGHNGYFPDLLSIVHFYNTRDVPMAWPAPEVTFGMNTVQMGHLGLSHQDELDLVAFMKTLTDGYF